jgi:hypothetical protein
MVLKKLLTNILLMMGLILIISMIPIGCIFIQLNRDVARAERTFHQIYKKEKFSNVRCLNDYSSDGYIDCLYENKGVTYIAECHKNQRVCR